MAEAPRSNLLIRSKPTYQSIFARNEQTKFIGNLEQSVSAKLTYPVHDTFVLT